jgi:hypothetical protein
MCFCLASFEHRALVPGSPCAIGVGELDADHVQLVIAALVLLAHALRQFLIPCLARRDDPDDVDRCVGQVRGPRTAISLVADTELEDPDVEHRQVRGVSDCASPRNAGRSASAARRASSRSFSACWCSSATSLRSASACSRSSAAFRSRPASILSRS